MTNELIIEQNAVPILFFVFFYSKSKSKDLQGTELSSLLYGV